MAFWLRVHIAFVKDPSSVHSTHIRQLTVLGDLVSSSALHGHLHKHTHIHMIKNNKFKKLYVNYNGQCDINRL